MTHLFGGLPVAIRGLLTVFVLVAALTLAFFGAQSLRFGAQLGKRRGDPTSASYLGGGVGGLLGGSIGLSASQAPLRKLTPQLRRRCSSRSS